MNPTDNQNTNPVNPTPVVTPPASPAPEKVGNPVQKADKKFLIYGVVIGLVVVVLVGVVGFYIMFSPKSNDQVANVTTVSTIENESEPTPIEVAQVEGAGDLDNLLVGLAEADDSLDQELANLEKDSEF